jgi:AraC-like DNA-binding protein
MNLNIVETLTLLGAIQGLGLASILFFSKKHSFVANKIFAVFVTIFSLHIFRELLETHGYLADYDLIRGLSLTFTGYYAPLLYLYVITLVKVDTKLTVKHSVHFIIAITASITYTVGILNGITDWDHMRKYPWLVYLISTLQILIVFQSFTYIYLSFRWLRKYRDWLQDNLSTIDQLGYQWLTRLLCGFGILILIWVLVFGADVRILEIAYYAWVFDLFWLAISLFIYWIGYYSLLKPEILTIEFKQVTKTRPSDLLDQETIVSYKEKLIHLFKDEKLFLEPDLTLKMLANKIQLNEKKLSQVLNRGFKQSFYNLINQYRVEEVKRCLLLPHNNQSKIEVLAYEAGFKSATTFNRQFKRFTKMTPKAFRSSCSM